MNRNDRQVTSGEQGNELSVLRPDPCITYKVRNIILTFPSPSVQTLAKRREEGGEYGTPLQVRTDALSSHLRDQLSSSCASDHTHARLCPCNERTYAAAPRSQRRRTPRFATEEAARVIPSHHSPHPAHAPRHHASVVPSHGSLNSNGIFPS